MKQMINKLKLNSLIDLNKKELTISERADLVNDLLKVYTYNKLSEMTGVPKSTLFQWRKRYDRENGQLTENTYISFLYNMNKRIDQFKDIKLEKRRADISDLTTQINAKLRIIKDKV